MSGKRVAHIDSSLFSKPPPTFKLPSTLPPNSRNKIKRDEPEKPSTYTNRNDNISDNQNNYKDDSSARLSQNTPQYVLTATQSFMMTPMNNVQVIQNTPSVPIQNPPMSVDPNYYAFYYDPKSTSAFTPAAYASTAPVSYSPSMAPYSLPPPLPPVPPPQNPPPPPPPSTTSYRSSYSPTSKYTSTPPPLPPTQYSPTPQQYSSSASQFIPTTASSQYSLTSSQSSQYTSFTKPAYYKRTSESEDFYKKNMRKRKKPLSQNIPQRKDWSVEDAKRALEVEKDCNKRNKRQSLIIKFPDLELNRLIVANFHESIDSVHFQQPSTPRFCFVTLQDSADPETVIQQLNRIPFGQGYLTAEFKKDREDEINIGPEDIDPLTLYVGNLAQDVTKDDMVKAYPKQKRIDIGYAKKMKYTRYAFVSFKNVDDSIEAFQSTHATQMYSKSLIVRFRRLHGTVGMPGESKLPPNPRTDTATPPLTHPHDEKEPDREATGSPWDIDISRWEEGDSPVKEERDYWRSDEEVDTKPSVMPFKTNFMPGSADVAFALHKPKILVKSEREEGEASTKDVEEKVALPKPMVLVKPELDDKEDASLRASPVVIQSNQYLPKLKINPQNASETEINMMKEEESKSNLENVSFPMPISVKKEFLEEVASKMTDSNSVDEKYIRKMFTPISVKKEPEDDKMDLGVSFLQKDECDNFNSVNKEVAADVDRNEQSAMDASGRGGIEKNGSQSQFEFGDWIKDVPSVKNEPIEEDDMDDGIDSSGDEFSFSHIVKSKKTKRINSAIV